MPKKNPPSKKSELKSLVYTELLGRLNIDCKDGSNEMELSLQEDDTVIVRCDCGSDIEITATPADVRKIANWFTKAADLIEESPA